MKKIFALVLCAALLTVLALAESAVGMPNPIVEVADDDEFERVLGIDVDADDMPTKKVRMSIIGGTIGVKDGKFFQTYDSRYPTNTSGKKIADTIREKAGDAAEVTMVRDDKPFYISLDNPCIRICIDSYNSVTGENAEPYTIGGGTYARDFPNAVSFGPEHPERPHPAFAGPIHGVDEAASLADMLEALKIYILALIRLSEEI